MYQNQIDFWFRVIESMCPQDNPYFFYVMLIFILYFITLITCSIYESYRPVIKYFYVFIILIQSEQNKIKIYSGTYNINSFASIPHNAFLSETDFLHFSYHHCV